VKERRSRKIVFPEITLKEVSVEAKLTIAAGWSVSTDGDVFSFSFQTKEEICDQGKRRARPLEFESYEVRRRFMEIEKPGEALSFFRTYGPLDVETVEIKLDETKPGRVALEPNPSGIVAPGSAGIARDLSFAALLEQKARFAKAMTDPKSLPKSATTTEFLRFNAFQSPAFEIVLGRPPYLLTQSAFVSQAIYATIYLDVLMGLKSVHCLTCHSLVRQRNKHFLRFCSQRCGNLWRKKEFLERQEKKNAKT
jgi:hypothetical protein